jgi:phosphoenolpyruvate carboxykinase (GTP)
MSSEMTAAAAGGLGQLRFDPFAMLPFCGYNMADYFAHWLDIGKHDGADLPKIFYVNWFRKDPESGRFLWPGFGENSRVLKWVFERCAGTAEAVEGPLGLVPTEGAIDTTGLDMSEEDLATVLEVDVDGLRQQLPQVREFLAKFGDDLPHEVSAQLDALEGRLAAA